MTDQPATRIADDINELLRTRTTHETHTTLVPVPRPELWEQIHVVHSVTHASLLDQLHAAITTSSMTSDDTYRSIAQSKPSARLDAIETLQRIDRASTRWAQVLRSRVRVPLEDRLRGIVGAAANADPSLLVGDQVVKGGLTRAVHGWVIAARVATGWERPTWSPNVPCPNIDCEQRGTIRVRLEQGIGMCTACETFWDRDNIAILGDYVRWAAEHLAGARHWLYDADGYPCECTECLLTRQVMAERQAERIRAGRAATRALRRPA